ncbi:MAG: ABC-type transport auxiliary lipoprotein family protein [Campylobacterota bacterium]|nr:ABC-type transport auxiliary lipoprotein family protein [Campylobacterota bacterium]
MNKFISLFIVITSTIVFSGCNSTKLPSNKVYSIETSKECCNEKFDGTDKILKILEPVSSKHLNTTNIYYSDNKYKLQTYKLSKWSDYPSKMILDTLILKLDENSIYKNITTVNIYDIPDHILQSQLFEFKQVIEENQSFVKLRIKFYLISNSDKKKIISKTFDYKTKCISVDAYGAVEAKNKTIEKMIADVSDWLSKKEKASL